MGSRMSDLPCAAVEEDLCTLEPSLRLHLIHGLENCLQVFQYASEPVVYGVSLVGRELNVAWQHM